MACCLLAIESSGDVCSVAVYFNGSISQELTQQPRKHSEFILPAIDGLLSTLGIGLGDLDAIVFACGPGSFTGIRIAAAMTQGLALSHNVPIISVSSLAALAQTAHRKLGLVQVASCVDARINEVYWGVYKEENQLMVLQGTEVVCRPEDIPFDTSNIEIAVGSGVLYKSQVMDRCSSIKGWESLENSEAHDVITLGIAQFEQQNFVSVEQAVPVYLRDKVTWKKLPGR
ncbi:MAG: tRNA (adenosine(37)-N6)-threonylcarbamoyltransferase complex dimerization subunit type 1 TsaB [Moraxellaceae bacterium]|nr:MAG: tRNA (adenosine(37)-N6)-threonylcarbamoyltransferase complex dimerization subunit type 1 TsaB [Moraxellaceae bacterium]